MNELPVDGGFWIDALIVLTVVYLSMILFRQAFRIKGDMRSALLSSSLLLLPLLLVSWFVYDGAPLDVFSSGHANSDSANWWVLALDRESGDSVTVNLFAAGVAISALYIVSTFLIWVGSAIYFKKTKVEWLTIHKALLKWPILIVGCLICLKIDLGTILLGTSVAVIGIGLVLKETLENLFTGMSLEMEGTVRQGDWIEVGDTEAGVVYEKNWRATKIRTLNDESVTIPNRLLGSEKIKNYNRPMTPHARNLYVGTSYNDPPVKVKEILRTILLREPEILKNPMPLVRTIAYDDFSINFEMKFWIRDYGRRTFIEDKVMTHVWYSFKFYGVQIPFPIRTVHMKEMEDLEEEDGLIEDSVRSKMEFLMGLDYFGQLVLKDFDFLARNSFRKPYASGENVVSKGEIGDALYIVAEGSCEALLPDGRRPQFAPGKYFGEMGLFTVGPRTVDVVAGADGALVLRVDKHCMDILFRTYPDLRKEIRAIRDARKKDLLPEHKVEKEEKPKLLRRVGRAAVGFFKPW
jgi:small-conductance mechanosensitive channel